MLTNIENAHRLAMEAKQTIFKAQDALSLAWSDCADGKPEAPPRKVLEKAEKHLARVRRELEQLDNAVRPELRKV